MTKLASRAAEFRPSQTLAMRGLVMRLRAEGRDIIPLLGGEPDYFAPENVKRAGMDAIRNNQTKYTSANGTLELRQALSKKFNRTTSWTMRRTRSSSASEPSPYYTRRCCW